MRHLLQAAAGALLVAMPVSAGDAAAQSATAASARFDFRAAGADIVRHSETGLVSWMSEIDGRTLARASAGAAQLSFTSAAGSFLESQASAFGLDAPGVALSTMGARSDNFGNAFVHFQQRYKGVPIIAAELNVQLDGARNVLSVNGESVGDLDLSVDPDVASADARRTAIAATARYHRVDASSLSGSSPSLAIHDARVMGGPKASPRLVWRVDVTGDSHPDIRELVLVDAQNGRVVVQFNQQPHAAPPANADQWVCDANNTSEKYPCKKGDKVNKPGSSSVQDVKSAFRFAENTFDFYARRFNRNSLDNKGLRLRSTVRLCPVGESCPYPNAFWDGKQMVYGDTYASGDDVVGHELSHGVTDFTSHLLYYYQSGAINESMSDIFGEFIDQTNGVDGSGGNVKWMMGEDLPIGAIRNMEDPPQFNDPDSMTSTLWTGDLNFLDRGGVHTNSGVGNKTAYLIAQTGKRKFLGRTVKGIGIDKAAAIFYRVNAFMLNSGSDYADLGQALKLACKQLTGTRPKNNNGKPSADGKISKDDCKQVGQAVAATKLNKKPQFWAIAKDAPVCTGGKSASNVLLENFESSKRKFQPADSHWGRENFYAASNRFGMAVDDFGSGAIIDSALTQKDSKKIPAGAFLRFAQYYSLRSDVDTSNGHATTAFSGVVVEYKVGSGGWKRVGQNMFTHNGYNATIENGGDNPLGGDKAFSGFSGGWSASRIDLASLQGKDVRFRFRIGTDNVANSNEWFVDDIRIYRCVSKNKSIASAD